MAFELDLDLYLLHYLALANINHTHCCAGIFLSCLRLNAVE